MRWLKKSGHYYRREEGKLKRYCPGDIIEAERHELGGHIDTFEPIGPEPEKEQEQPSIGLMLQHKGSGRFNVINRATGNPINDRLLGKAEALELIDKGGSDATEMDGPENMA